MSTANNDLLNFLNQSWFWGIIAFACSFVVMAVTGRGLISWLKGLPGMKWSAREDTPDTHLQKAGTPSMGGLGIVASAFAGYCAVCSVAGILTYQSLASLPPATATSVTASIKPTQFVAALLLLPLMTIAHMVLGYIDDWSKATGRGGLRARAKFAGQVALSVAFLYALYWLTINQSLNGVRFFASGNNGDFLFDASDPLILLLVGGFLLLVLLAMCNAVNITDGIDGLAAGLALQCGLCLYIIGSENGNVKLWGDIWWMALAGAGAGFLIFNKYKAQIFMGDTGSLALGAALGGAAVMGRAVFLLPFIGFIFWIELFSVTAQVLYFKYTRRKTGEGQRIFRRAPLHHHFELGGWSEWRVVITFWLINIITSAIGLLLWSLDILPRFP